MNRPHPFSRRNVVAEQQAFDKQQREALLARVRRAARLNTDLTWELIAERFGLDPKTVGRWCRDIPRDPDWIMDRRRSA